MILTQIQGCFCDSIIWDGAERSLDHYGQFGQRFCSVFKFSQGLLFYPVNPSFIQRNLSPEKDVSKGMWQWDTGQHVVCHCLCNCTYAPFSMDNWDVEMVCNGWPRQKDNCVPAAAAAFLCLSCGDKQLLTLMRDGAWIEGITGGKSSGAWGRRAQSTPEEASRSKPGF